MIDEWGIPIFEAKGKRYFHVTSLQAANDMTKNGYSHAHGPEWMKGGNRFSYDDKHLHDWFNYYHLFFPLFSKEKQKELQKTLWNDDIDENIRAEFIRDEVQKSFGDDWTIIWLGTNKLFTGYGDTVVEFFPTTRDKLIANDGAGYTVFVTDRKKIPANQFKNLGTISDEGLE